MNDVEQSHAFLASLIDSSDDAIISLNLEGAITSWNKAAEAIFGYTSQEAVGQPITLLVPPERIGEESEILKRINKGERIRHYQTVRRAKSGSLVQISLTVSPIIQSGRVIGASKIARDVSRERATVEQLEQSEERFRVTLSSIGDAVIATDKDGGINFMNAVAEQLTGWGQRQAFGLPLDDVFKIVNEYSRKTVESPVTKVIREGTIVGMANHTVLISKDGTERPIDDSGAPIRKGTGDLNGVVLVFRDVTERRAAELTALKLAAIVQNSDDAIVSKNLDGIITSWNEGARRIFGYTAEEVIGKSVTLLIPSELRLQEDEILAKLRRGERVVHFETTRVAKDGRSLPVSLTISPVKDPEGRVVGASKIARDITERKQTERVLKQTQERLRVTLSSIGDAVIATDKEGRINFMNAVAEQLTGWSQQGSLGLPLDDVFKIVNEYTRKTVENPVAKVIREGTIVGLANHTLLISKDGKERPIDDSGAPIRGEDGDINGVVLVFRDVTERRAAELTALRLAAIVQNSDDAIISKNLDGIITSWNEGARRIFGYAPEEVIGKSVKLLVPSELQQQEDEILAKLRRGGRVLHFETNRVAKDGRSVPVSLSISPVKDPEGRVVGASKIARDITERKQVERALAEAKEGLEAQAVSLERQVQERTRTLERTVAELEAFSYSLSHDMRAPLRAIESFLQIVLSDYGERIGAEGTDLLNKAMSAARRMDRLITDLLIYTRLSRVPASIEPVDVERLIRGIIRERSEFQPPNVEIEIDSPLLRVAGNEASLTQCITNLLDNAVKFVAPGTKPQVRIYSERMDGTVRLWFQDNGIGIDTDGRSRLFHMFQRIHVEGYPGTGIGLAIVRKAVERMQGETGVESEPGRGSRFWVQLREVVP